MSEQVPLPGAQLAPAEQAAPGSSSATQQSGHGHGHGHGGSKWPLLIGALGVVFGDIGTSPLYAIKECFSPESKHHVVANPTNILGILSLVFWALMISVTVKYLTFIMKADNEGSGGILALLALVPQRKDAKPGVSAGGPIVLLALFGSALLYGDGIITPAISVLSAMEGLEVATTSLKPAILPITIAILLGLFLMQKRGTAGVGAVFGPMTFVWFVMIGVLGGRYVISNPSVLAAINPMYAVQFFAANKGHGVLLLGSVVLCITGGEALYADMSHFGLGPIRADWYAVVLPSLLLNYFGQGALLLQHPELATNPFYSLVPSWFMYPAVVVSTGAAIVASQALISGAFSLTQQAVQLGYFPRVTIVHTSKETEGQIYIPEINNALLVACIWLVLSFKTSTALAATYGIAVTITMAITSVVYFVVATQRWGWPVWKALPPVTLFLAVDIAFFAGNVPKVVHGGWFPLLIAGIVFTAMTTWKSGRKILGEAFTADILPLQDFLDDVRNTAPHRVRGTAVFMSSNPQGTPPVLLHHFKHNQVLHEQVVLLSVTSEHVPEIPPDKRLTVEDEGQGFYRVSVRYGFMQTPNVPNALLACKEHGLAIDPRSTSYYLGRETLLTSGKGKMMRWRKTLFAFISRNARPATSYFGLPPGRVVELGMQIDL